MGELDRTGFERIEALFHQLAGSPADEQRRALEAVSDPVIKQRVAELLNAEAGASTRIDRAVAEAKAEANLPMEVAGGSSGPPLEHREKFFSQLPEPIPGHLGPYRILREIGRGGFATVYLAERDDGAFKLRVAIKLVRHGASNREIAERLHRERQFLARLQHPNIARILDGGSAEDGAPFVVMEWIDGEPIDVYCRNRALDLHQRLELIRQICSAVELAHRNLILHRDIKPSNILVGRDGVPKLLDFGIAKALRLENEDSGDWSGGNPGREQPLPNLPDLPEATKDPELLIPASEPLTRLGTLILTPEFASPEQFLGQPLETTTDIYSLGLVLYLLVSDHQAYELEGDNPADWQEIICHRQPLPPSFHGELKRGDRARPARRHRWPQLGFGNDLDLIVLEAVHKDPQRRYPSARALDDDLRRYLGRLPIRARHAGWLYPALRFLGRHTLAVAAASLVSLLLASAALVAINQSRVAEHQGRRSERAVALLVGMLEGSNPHEGWAPETTARQVLEEGAKQIHWELKDDPELRAEMFIILGRVFRSLAAYDESERYLSEGLEILKTLPQHHESSRIDATIDLGKLFQVMGRCEPSARLLEEARDAAQHHSESRPELSRALYVLGMTRHLCGDPQAGEGLLRKALALRVANLGNDSREAIETRAELARTRLTRGDFDSAEAGLSQALDSLRRTLPETHPEIAILISDLAAVQERRGDPASAVELYRQALEMQRSQLGERHDAIARTLHNLANAELARGDKPAARAALEEALGMLNEIYDDDHPLKATCLYSLGRLRRYAGEWAEAESFLRQSLEARVRLFGDNHESVGQSRFALARVVARRDPSQAESLFRQTLELLERILPADDYRLSYPLFRWAILRLDQGDAGGAEPLFRRAWEIRRASLPDGSWEAAVAGGWLGRSVGRLGRVEEARELLESSLQQLEKGRGVDDARTKTLRGFLAELPGPKASIRFN